jgi:hypothetical protein
MNKQNAPAKSRGRFAAMTMWFAAPLAVIFALATLTVPPNIKAEKEKAEQTEKGPSKEKSGKAEESSPAVSKGKRHQRTEREE